MISGTRSTGGVPRWTFFEGIIQAPKVEAFPGSYSNFPSLSCLFSIMDAREFEWESQLRFYWDREPDELNVRQCTGTFAYGYEYMGLNGRLVITPLTDRIYLTLTQV